MRKLFTGLVVIVLLIAGVYYGLSFYIFNQLTAISPACGADFMATKIDNTPTEFVVQFKKVDAVTEAPELWMASYEDVSFEAREDDITISGWFIPAPAASDHAIIVVHGHNSCKRDSTQLIPASMLHQNGYNVLIIDLRNHGDSEILNGRITAGNTEARDVLGAFDYLQQQGFDADNIGLVGMSMGSATSAIAFGMEQQIPALWLDSPYAQFADVIVYNIDAAGLPGTLLRPGVQQIASLYGIDFDAETAGEQIQTHNGRPIHIIHGEADDLVPFTSGEVMAANGGDAVTFIPFPDMRHLEAMYAEQEEYETALVGFFDSTLRDGQ